MPDQRPVAEGVVAFGRALSRLGIPVATSQIEAAARSLTVVDTGSRNAVYWALHCTLLVDRGDQEAFDQVFESFWNETALEVPYVPPGAMDGTPDPTSSPRLGSKSERGEVESSSEDSDGIGEDGGEDPNPVEAGAAFSAYERLRRLDFDSYGEQDMLEAERAIGRLGRTVPMRLARRLRSGDRGIRLDLRETMRQSMRTEAHPLDLAWRRRRLRPRPLVFLIDISGSMQSYARPMFAFAWGARRSSRRVEAFAFGTRLTRLTGALDRNRYQAALTAVADAVPDWAGGTRIGESLTAFSRGWGRRGMSRGAAVVIVSDGWERGDLSELDTSMATIRRLAHSVVWVNPLAADRGYEPLAAGMATALPHVDLFLPGHSIEDLRVLAHQLGSLPTRRMRRSIPTGSRTGQIDSAQV